MRYIVVGANRAMYKVLMFKITQKLKEKEEVFLKVFTAKRYLPAQKLYELRIVHCSGTREKQPIIAN